MNYQCFERFDDGDTLFFTQKVKQQLVRGEGDQFLSHRAVLSVPDGEGLRIAVGEYGICINGDAGGNPPGAEMQEWVEVMRECVAWFDTHFKKEAADGQ